MSLKKRFEKLFWVDEEEVVKEPKEPKAQQKKSSQPPVRKETKMFGGKKRASRPAPKTGGQPQTPVISLQSLQKSSEHLKNKRSVVVNLQQIERDQGIRIIDFLSGTVYALGGDIQRIGTDTFLCAPDNVEVAGSITEYSPE